MDELAQCDHVYVFREGAIVADLAARRDDRGEGHPRLVPGGRVTAVAAAAAQLCCRRASLALLLAAIFWLQPRTMSYFGLNLLLNLAVPIALATIAQMFLLCVNDLDLSIGAFVSLVACIAATWLHDTPLLGVLALAVLVAVYAGMGALIELRQAAVDRRHAWHVLRLARARGDGAADAGRQGARLGARADDAEALAGAVPDHRLGASSRSSCISG